MMIVTAIRDTLQSNGDEMDMIFSTFDEEDIQNSRSLYYYRVSFEGLETNGGGGPKANDAILIYKNVGEINNSFFLGFQSITLGKSFNAFRSYHAGTLSYVQEKQGTLESALTKFELKSGSTMVFLPTAHAKTCLSSYHIDDTEYITPTVIEFSS